MLSLYAVLAVASLLGTQHVSAATPTLIKPVQNIDIPWMKGSSDSTDSDPARAAIAVEGGTVSIDVFKHFERLTGYTLSAVSDAPAVATVALDNTLMKLTVISPGSVNIRLIAQKDGSPSIVDTFQAVFTKIGDVTGDGVVTAADALYITKVVNAKTPLTAAEINMLDINRDGVVTSADASYLLSTYVGKSGTPAADSAVVTLKSVNDAPYILNARITALNTLGSPADLQQIKKGFKLSASYDYWDMEDEQEGSSAIRWFKGKLQDGTDKVAIAGATTANYVIQPDDEQYYLFAELTPQTAAGAKGDTVRLDAGRVPDTTPPTVVNVEKPADSTYVQGDRLVFKVKLSEPVMIDGGPPSLGLVIGTETRSAEYDAQLSSPDTLVFAYTVVNNDLAPGGIAIGAVSLSSGVTVGDLAGNAADFTLGSIPTGNVKVDAVKPWISQVTAPDAGTYVAGNRLRFKLQMSEPVLLTGAAPVLDLQLGAASKSAEYNAVESTATLLVFDYTAADGDLAVNGIEVGPLRLSGAAAIKDAAGNPATLSFSPIDGSVIKVDAVAPSAVRLDKPADGRYAAGKQLTFTVHIDETITIAGGAPTLPLTLGTVGKNALYDAAASTATDLIFTYAIANGDNAPNGIGVAPMVAGPGVIMADAAGNPVRWLIGTVDATGVIADTAAPVVDSFLPAHQAVNVAPGSDLAINFNEPVVAVDGKNVRIRNYDGNAVVQTYAVNDTSSVTVNVYQVTLKNASLNNNNEYYIEIDAGAFKDLAGNEYAGISGNNGWKFAAPDTIAPTVTSLTPADDTTNVTPATPLSITFSENVVAGNGKFIYIRQASNSVAVATYSVTDTTYVTISGKTVNVANPSLQEGQSYYIEVDSGAFVDLSGNAFAGMSGPSAWNFTIPDVTPPTIVSRTPANGAVDAAVSGSLSITFSENVVPVTGKSAKIRRASDQNIITAISVTDTTTVTVSGSVVTMAHPNLADETDYYVEMDAGAFRDTAGNDFAGISGSAGWSFKTADTTPPVVLTRSPQANQTGVSKTADFTLTFSEPIALGDLSKNVRLFQVGNPSPVVTYSVYQAVYVTLGTSSVTIKNPGLSDDQEYYIEIDGGAFKDQAGNPFAGISGPSQWNFSTPDSRTMTAADAEEFSEAQMLSSGGAVLELTLVGDSFADSLADADIEIFNAPPGLTVSYAAKITASTAYVFLNYDGTDFDENVTNFTVKVKGTGLKSGRALTSNPLTITATIETFDYVSLSPVNGAANVNKTDNLVLTFDKNVTAVSDKTIRLYYKTNNQLAATISATDTAKVKISGKTVTIEQAGLRILQEYYVMIDPGAFKYEDGSTFVGIEQNTAWTLKTTLQTLTGPFISEYDDGGDGRRAIEIMLYDNTITTSVTGYSIDVYRYVGNQISITNYPILELWNNVPYIGINRTFYDPFDKANIWYVNEDNLILDDPPFNAIVLKKNSQVYDVLGDPTATTYKPFLSDGGTLVRIQGIKGGTSSFDIDQWNIFPKGTFQYLGSHTP
ncbi:Ig-like domain-containing protein [Paenibacillus thalictri]|nr:Ig-like domain-containing protein [Paenibacillus thalictri]